MKHRNLSDTRSPPGLHVMERAKPSHANLIVLNSIIPDDTTAMSNIMRRVAQCYSSAGSHSLYE